MIDTKSIENRFKAIQDSICQQLESADGKGQFREDLWQRDGGGGGRTRIIEGEHIAKGGVNFSAVHGALPDKIANALKVDTASFFASGVSIVLHPKNPHVPIIHMNIRYFELDNGIWWFGGGIDLTPHYVVEEDARYFHQTLKKVCDQHSLDYYPKFKKWADDYFYVKHRKETRGIGGIFFDRLGAEDGFTKQKRFDYVCAVGETFAPLYVELLHKNKAKEFGERELEWQRVRRGRYVEFNLVWDKGTKFGLDTDGRTESILMSLPPMASWVYNHQTKEGSPEAETLKWLKKDINWLD